MALRGGAENTPAGRRRQRGAVLVETALVAPIVLALLLGTVTGALAYGRKNSMTNAAREGARLGATMVVDGDWAAATRDRVVDVAGGDLTAAQVCVAIVYKATPADTTGTPVQSSPCSLPSGSEPSLAAGTAVNECVVKIWSRRSSTFETGFFSRDVTLTASAVARYERGSGMACS